MEAAAELGRHRSPSFAGSWTDCLLRALLVLMLLRVFLLVLVLRLVLLLGVAVVLEEEQREEPQTMVQRLPQPQRSHRLMF